MVGKPKQGERIRTWTLSDEREIQKVTGCVLCTSPMVTISQVLRKADDGKRQIARVRNPGKNHVAGMFPRPPREPAFISRRMPRE